MISNFFIDRPIFATVLSVVITLVGGIALFYLPVAQYPPIRPPAVSVSISYPGASAQVVADTVAAPIEQQVNGVDGMLYMSSQMGNDGTYSLTITFDLGTNLKTALVMVQNRVTLAMPQLPTEVQNQGITIRKRTPDNMMIVNLFSPDGRYDDIYLSNFALIYIKDELLRVDGVADVNIMGERDYSIRAWLDPQKLASRNMTAIDVARAIRSQNLDSPAGQVGSHSSLGQSSEIQAFQYPIDTLGRLTTPDQFGGIIIKAGGVSQPAPPTASGMGRGRGGIGSGLPGDQIGDTPLDKSIVGTSATVLNPNSGTTSPNSSSTIITQTASGVSTAGGASTGGGGNVGGGGTTRGGGTIIVTQPADTITTTDSGTPADSGTTTSPTDDLTSGLSITSNTGGDPVGGVISSERGPGRPSVSIVRLRDVATVEMGAQNYNQSCTFDGKPSVGLNVFQLPTANALDAGDRVKAKMAELKKHFPDGVDYRIGYDITPFIRESVIDVVKTLLEAVLLVGVVVLFFLQDWRAVILPMIDVPVSLIGTFAVMAVLGFSLNNISLFGLVLAIGIVVDDAIVVLENIERLIATGLDARTATIKAMEEVTGPIIAVALVLCAVFVPCAVIRGITGQFFRQFAVTISVSTVISAINAVTMTPSRAVMIFKTEQGSQGHEHKKEALPWWIFGGLGGFLGLWLANKYLAGHWGFPALPGLEDQEQDATWMTWAIVAGYLAPGVIVGALLGWLLITPVNFVLGLFFRGFNRGFDWMASIYGWVVGKSLRRSSIVLVIYCGLLVLTWYMFQKAPTGFIPQQDQGRLIVNIQLPDSASLQRTQETVALVDKIARETPGVAHTVAICGMSFILQANGPNFASMFIVLDPFDKRQKPGLRDTAIAARLRREWGEKIKDGLVSVFGAPPVPGLGVAGGFKLMVEDRGGLGLANLQEQTDSLLRKLVESTFKVTDKAIASLQSEGVPEEVLAKLMPLKDKELREEEFKTTLGTSLSKDERAQYQPQILKQTVARAPIVANANTQFRANTPQLFLDIDRSKAAALGVSLDDVNQTLDMYLGSLYVNSFNDFGRHWQVTIQAEGKFRNQVENIHLLQVRNKWGQMVSVGTLVKVREVGGPIAITRFNLSTAAAITGNLPTGVSTGDGIRAINRLSNRTLPISMKAEWTELMFMEIKAGNTALYIFALSVVSVFLALSALYESWSLPLAVILVVPLCLLCSVVGVLYTKRDVNIFVQIGLVVLVGLACKNAILIVEYAKQLHQEGLPRFEATVRASRWRLRPILMTSFAFIFGVIPLMIASGAGAEMRRSLGTAVFSGMLGVTIFGIFLTPVFFYVIQGFDEGRFFAGTAIRWIVSILVGGGLGFVSGFLMGELEIVPLYWAVTVGPFVGVLTVVAVSGIHRTIRLRSAEDSLLNGADLEPSDKQGIQASKTGTRGGQQP